MRNRNLIIEIIGGLLILLFVYTIGTKLLDYEIFKRALYNSLLIGERTVFVAPALLITETLFAGLLFFPKTRLWGLYGSAFLLSVLTSYLVYVIYFTSSLPDIRTEVLTLLTWKQHIVFNIFFLALSFTGIGLEKKKRRMQQETEMPPVVFT